MQCERCGEEDSKVIRTETKYPVYDKCGQLLNPMLVERQRICNNCEFVFWTEERCKRVSVYDPQKMKKIFVKIEEYKIVNQQY